MNLADDFHPSLAQRLEATLETPLRDYLARPAKGFRRRLVRLGYSLAQGQGFTRGDERSLEIGGNAIELLHSGSLIIDDIQDDSATRRGGPSYHVLHGVPIAIATGSLLYFRPLSMLRQLSLADAALTALTERYFVVLEEAHLGQLMDVGTDMVSIPQSEVTDICEFTHRHKTGSLTSLAFELGGLIAGGNHETCLALRRYGYNFGIVLQKLDDLGNVVGSKDQERVLTDLKSHRPSWLWAIVARSASQAEFQRFVSAIQALPESGALSAFLKDRPFITTGLSDARRDLEEALKELSELSNLKVEHLQQILAPLADELMESFQ